MTIAVTTTTHVDPALMRSQRGKDAKKSPASISAADGTEGSHTLYGGREETTVQLNTSASISLGRRVHSAFGSWRRAREMAVRTPDGVYKLDESVVARAAEERKGE